MHSHTNMSTLHEALQSVGETPDSIVSVQPVSGGSISRAFQVETNQHTYFFKWKQDAPDGFFRAERDGLRLLADAGARVPEVYAFRDEHDGWILMEWIPASGTGGYSHRAAEALGRMLATLHSHRTKAYGLDADNFIGPLPQANGWMDSWTDFYRERRLLPQIQLAARKRRLPSKRAKRLNRLLDRLDEWLDVPDIRPALLHGDLWGGNWMTGKGDLPWLIDPAVYYGHREVDLAMSELFGGFPPSFYAAYREVYPLEPGYEDRKPLYQLYYLLVHLNLFGESYGPDIDRICLRYVG
jgi:fructosamine-3-kinase